jgi:predicted HAD superfamily Cof-like phosphohydrolase
MEEAKALASVSAFHTTFGHPILPKPEIPAKERVQLRINLLREELDELEEAANHNNIVEVADALCDLQYVLSGAILEFGLGDKFAALFAEVQRSNMSKACATQADAEATLAHYRKKGMDGAYTKTKAGYLCHRIADGKTLKSVSYSPANLKAILST